MTLRTTHLGLVAIALAACSTQTTTAPPPSPAPPAEETPAETPEAIDPDLRPDLVKGRPYGSKAPSDYDGSTKLPLVVALHGWGGSGGSFVRGTKLAELVEEKRFLLAYPTGSDVYGKPGWVAMKGGEGFADDLTYLRAVIADMASRYEVDRTRIVLVGLSLGSFMSNYLACKASDVITSVVSFSGSLLEAESKSCTPARPLSMTFVHGTADDTVAYEGGTLPQVGKFLGAPELYAFWSEKHGCGAESALPAQDLDSAVAGAETTGVTRSCNEGTKVTLLTAKDGAHVLSIPKKGIADLLVPMLAPTQEQ